ncbi:MAG: FAD-binding oxidoreductase [Candidatus Marinimicrobia bacterium]|jgi:glycolate oxidase FAD binding subunit|nr:FAD-binding oxidoreductase [Candidatus Neomarinimicrobiota bacterium]MDP6593361.1 FAD-binding oxidoreductase [Candidatus Neomarinimicrobiota bacterium]MDP6836964.1 FAD-binding oxidoreductase [Candidatus Neomarinimicrobiota bacterium]MDP6966144.1 FAD-binding oxidoreductase [Candidatus Neomarinimicrobiota bacterium]
MKTALETRLAPLFAKEEISLSIESVPARITVYPKTAEQVCELVKMAAQDGITLLPVGGATHLYRNGKTLDVAVSLSSLPQSTAHSPPDLTATLPAGLSFSRAQESLMHHGQHIPLNPPIEDRSTVGGIISTDSWGPRRHRYGTARDLVIATTLVNATGEMVHAGAKVVKNVSGYDMNKLYIGARGTLGILLDVSFKLYPEPEKRVTFTACFNAASDAFKLATEVNRSQLDLEAMTVVKGSWTPGKTRHWWLLMNLAGPTKGLKPQIDQLQKLHQRAGARSWKIASESDAQTFWRTANDSSTSSSADGDDEEYLARIALPKKNLLRFIAEFSGQYKENLSFKILPGAGICYLAYSNKFSEQHEFTSSLIDHIRSFGGSVEFERLGQDTQERWPILPDSLTWMRKTKEALDPNGIFAPGTFIDEL